MSATTDLRALLVAAPGVTAICGQRVRANRAEQSDVRPFVVFTRVQTEPQRALNGSTHGNAITFEVQCWADTRLQAEALGDAVQAALDAAHQYATNRTEGYDADLDLEVDLMTVAWWQD